MIKSKNKFKKLGQSMLEYATIIAVVSAALLAMYKYVHWALNARLKEVHLSIHERFR